MTFYTWARFKERWYISILVDICQIGLWATILHLDVNNVSAWMMVVSSITMMVSALYGVFNWQK
jgi:nicotinamide riboside transporter PnuC